MINKKRKCFLRKGIAMKKPRSHQEIESDPVKLRMIYVCQGGIGWNGMGKMELRGVLLRGFMDVKKINICRCMWFIYLHHCLQSYLSIDFFFYFFFQASLILMQSVKNRKRSCAVQQGSHWPLLASQHLEHGLTALRCVQV